jgi:carboxymethylenebutenolidase
MKHLNIILLILILPLAGTVFGQSCCDKPSKKASRKARKAQAVKVENASANATFVSFADDENFRNQHDEPLPINLEDPKGKNIRYATPDGKEAMAYEILPDGNTDRTILVIHEWWGLNDHIRAESEKIFAELNGKVRVLALDIYDGNVAETQEDASKFMQAVKEERAVAIIKGAFAYVGEESRVGTIGWCFGGGWSLQAAILGGEQVAACVMYYGMPEQNRERLSALSAPVLGIFAGKEQWINAEVVSKFEEDLKALDKTYTIRTFDADHAFANPSRPSFNEDAAEIANTLSMEFFREKLGL